MRRLRVQLTVLLALLGLLLAGWAAAILAGAERAARRDAAVRAEVARVERLRRAAARLDAATAAAAQRQRDALLTGDAAGFEAGARRGATALAEVRRLAAPWPALRTERLAADWDAWLRAGRAEVTAREAGGLAAAAATVRAGTGARPAAALRARQVQLQARLAELQAAAAGRAGGADRQVRALALRGAGLLLAAVALLAVWLGRAVGAPAGALRAASSRLAGGDLATPVALRASNELGAVAGDLEAMRRRLAGRLDALERLRQLSAQVVGATTLQRLCEVALEGLRPQLGATRAALGAVRPDGRLRLRAVAGFDDAAVADLIVKADREIHQLLPLPALRAGRVVAVVDLDQVPAPEPLRELVARMGVRAAALVPLASRGSLLGLLALFWTEPHAPDREQEALLELAGNQLAGASAAALRLEEAERAAGEARAVFYAIADGVLLTDRLGRVTAMNRALEALTGWTEADARGRHYAEVLPVGEGHVGDVRAGARRPAAPPDGGGIGVDLLTRYGRTAPVSVSSAPILDRRGRAIGGVDVVRDVAREREIDEVKSALISTVSHELRTPLTLIHGFAELLALRDMPPARRRTAAEEILEASRRLGRLIDDLLSVSRMESGRLLLDPRPLDLAGLVERTLSPFRAMATRHALRAKLPAALPVIWGDPDKVEQILTNLVGNAIKYSPEGGEVLVGVAPDGDGVRVSVRDQGIGMSPREMAQLFEKFYRVDREEVRRAGGTGLGLYITKRLVEMHGGRIWAESWPGAGSVFSFALPGGRGR